MAGGELGRGGAEALVRLAKTAAAIARGWVVGEAGAPFVVVFLVFLETDSMMSLLLGG